MANERAERRTVGAGEIDRLYDFLDGLQANGYKIDPRQYVALTDLLLALIARGESLDDISLKTWIAPVICATPAEQLDFYERFDRWYPTWVRARQASVSTASVAPAPQPPPARRSIFSTFHLWLLAGALLVLLAVGLVRWLVSRLPTTGTQVNINLYLVGGLVVAAVAIVALVWRLWRVYQENQYITRELAHQEPVYTKIPVQAYVQDILPVMQFKPVVSSLRRRTQTPSHEVDVDKTIDYALKNNNWLEIMYRQRHIMPEYVVLIDRKSRLDQQARFIQEVIHRLAADGVWLHIYEYSGDPRVCFPLDRKDVPLQLKDLQVRHPDSRLLMFTGSGDLIDPLTGHPQEWLEPLSYWRERAILTPDRIQQVLLEELQTREFALLPMTLDGLASLVRAFESDNLPLPLQGKRLPVPLRERPLRWTGRDAPPEEEIKILISNLQDYLSPDGLYWLCATAVYPELRWEFTLYLGTALRNPDGQALLNPENLLQLTHLPWFRLGYMPDWLRLELIKSMPEAEEEEVRKILGTLLETAFQTPISPLDLLVATRQPLSLSERSRRILRYLISGRTGEGALHDYIFLKFLLKKDEKRLAVLFNRLSRNFGFLFAIMDKLRIRRGAEQAVALEEEPEERGVVPLENELPDQNQRIEFLRRTQPFIGTPETVIKLAMNQLQVLPFPARTSLDVERAAYFVYRGKLRVIRSSERRPIVLRQGEQIGASARVSRQKLPEQIIAEPGTIVLKLSAAVLQELARINDTLRINLDILTRTQRLARALRSTWLRPKERILFLARRHYIAMIQKLIWIGLAILVWLGLSIAINIINPAYNVFVIAALFLIASLVTSTIGILWLYRDWRNDYCIVTDQRVVYTEKVVGIFNNPQEFPLKTVVSVTAETGALGRVLGFGTVTIRGALGTIALSNVAHPREVAAIVEAISQASDEQTNRAMREAFRKSQAEQMALSQNRQSVFDRFFGANPFRVRTEADNMITYRKHWVTRFVPLGPQILVFFVTLFLYVSIGSQPSALGAAATWFYALGFVLLAWIAVLAFRKLPSSSNDLYQITPEEVIILNRTPTGEEQRGSGSIKNIRSTTYQRSGVLGTIFNFGTVLIHLDQDVNLVMKDVINPARVLGELEALQNRAFHRPGLVSALATREGILKPKAEAEQSTTGARKGQATVRKLTPETVESEVLPRTTRGAPVVERPSTRRTGPPKYALVIANTDYRDAGLAQLTAPAKDAEEFARILRDPEICDFDEVTVLLNEQSFNVTEAIDVFFDQKRSDDLLLLYVSGHAVRDEVGTLFLAVRNTNRSRLRSTGVRVDYIREAMDQSRSRRQILILDCVNSRAFVQGTKSETAGSTLKPSSRISTGESLGTGTAFEGTGFGRVILTASDAIQVAWEGDRAIGETEHSLFTHFLIRGLEGEADADGDGHISVDELYDYAYEQMKRVTPTQTPSKWVYKQQGDIILRENLTPRVVRPAPLPTDLLQLASHQNSGVRRVAVQELIALLDGKHLGLARAAQEKLREMADNDDSLSVRKMASEALGRRGLDS